MFTGIVEEMGSVLRIEHTPVRCVLHIAADVVLNGTQLGDSIAVNGVCLTVTQLAATSFSADVMPETLRRSNLGQLRPGSAVNLERAMADISFPDTLTEPEPLLPCSRREMQRL